MFFSNKSAFIFIPSDHSMKVEYNKNRPRRPCDSVISVMGEYDGLIVKVTAKRGSKLQQLRRTNFGNLNRTRYTYRDALACISNIPLSKLNA